ncbi:hypothetical protein TNCT_120991 [Trichonephila clavata]|uniref:Uncharacterized protein n=1 Tax=Trichonephila clavata TaxID=2740835 RepID=A0A8X6HGI9_TRICU|nr:hypothetical protein TNCT_120991 [Trichonephila clavata]
MSTTKSSQPKTTEGCERPIGNMEKRPSFHPYRFEKDDDIVCLSREKKPEEEYSAASPHTRHVRRRIRPRLRLCRTYLETRRR